MCCSIEICIAKKHEFDLYFSIKFNQYRTFNSMHAHTHTHISALNHLLILLINNMQFVFLNPRRPSHRVAFGCNHLLLFS